MAYSYDLRMRAVDYFLNHHQNLREVSEVFQIGLGTLHRWVKRFQQTGDVICLKSPGRSRKISLEMMPTFQKFVLKNADDSLGMLAEKWREEQGESLCISAVSRTIGRMGITYKKKHFARPSEIASRIKKNGVHFFQLSRASRRRTGFT